MSISPLPPAPARTDPPAVFVPKADALVAALTPFQQEANALQVDVTNKQVVASDAAVVAVQQAGIATSAATNAAMSANAVLWVSGTSYTLGQKAISPINLNVYLRIVAGAGTTDPSIDSTNWRNASLGITTFSNITTSTNLLSGQGGYFTTAMTSLGQSVTLPTAVSLAPVSPAVTIDNRKGVYAVGVRNFAGKLLTAIAPGGIGNFALKDNSTAAGEWGIDGSGLEPGLITANSVLSSTYSTRDSSAFFVAFDDTTSLHFAFTASGGFTGFIVDSLSSTISVPVTIVSSVSTVTIHGAYKINATQAIVFFMDPQVSSGNPSAVVVTLTGTSPSFSISVGAVSTLVITSDPFWIKETGLAEKRIVQLAPSLFLASGSSNSANFIAVAVSVTGTTVSFGTIFQVPSGSNSSAFLMPLTATTAGAFWYNSQRFGGVVLTVTGLTVTSGTTAFGPSDGPSAQPTDAFAHTQLNTNKALMMYPQHSAGSPTGSLVMVCATASGTTMTFGTSVVVATAAIASANYAGYSANATRYNPVITPLTVTTALVAMQTSTFSTFSAVITENSNTLTVGTPLYSSYATFTAGGSGNVFQTLPVGPTEFVGVATQSSVTPPVVASKIMSSHRINGSTITAGTRSALQTFSITVNDSFAKLASGDYVVQGATGVEIFRSNGVTLTRRGCVAINYVPSGYVKTVVSANRLVLLNSTTNLATSSGVALLSITHLEVAT